MDTKLRPSILTVTGREFDFTDLDTWTFDPRDIAHALGHLCRFGGHPRPFYSVAEHSIILVDYLRTAQVDLELCRIALIHDATEAYIGDMVMPLKVLFPEFKKLESKILNAMLQTFKMVPYGEGYPVGKKWLAVEPLHHRLLKTEMLTVMCHADFPNLADRPLPVRLRHYAPEEASQTWYTYFRELFPEVMVNYPNNVSLRLAIEVERLNQARLRSPT